MTNSLKIIFVSFLILILTISCDSVNSDEITGSGDIVKIDYNFTGFNRIDAGHSFKVNIVKSADFSVSINVDDNIVEHLRVYKEGSTVYLGLNPDNDYNDLHLDATINMPDINHTKLHGATKTTLLGFEFDHSFSAIISGASNLSSEVFRSGLIDINLSGASSLNLTGTATRAKLNLSGASNAQLSDFIVEAADVIFSGASSGTVHVSGNLDVTLSGASSLFYKGDPKIGRADVTGASTLKKL